MAGCRGHAHEGIQAVELQGPDAVFPEFVDQGEGASHHRGFPHPQEHGERVRHQGSVGGLGLVLVGGGDVPAAGAVAPQLELRLFEA